MDRNDAGDIHHAIMSIAYCDYTLLDGKWEDLNEPMVRRFAELGLPIRMSKVFSVRRQGVERFLGKLEGAGVSHISDHGRTQSAFSPAREDREVFD